MPSDAPLTPPAAPLGAGDPAPGLVVDTHLGGRFRADEPGSATILVFVPAAYTPVCGGELDELLVLRERAAEQGVELVVASCDSTAVLAAWLREHGADDVLLGVSDFWPHGSLARAFGAFAVIGDQQVGLRAIGQRFGRQRRADAPQARPVPAHLGPPDGPPVQGQRDAPRRGLSAQGALPDAGPEAQAGKRLAHHGIPHRSARRWRDRNRSRMRTEFICGASKIRSSQIFSSRFSFIST